MGLQSKNKPSPDIKQDITKHNYRSRTVPMYAIPRSPEFS